MKHSHFRTPRTMDDASWYYVGFSTVRAASNAVVYCVACALAGVAIGLLF